MYVSKLFFFFLAYGLHSPDPLSLSEFSDKFQEYCCIMPLADHVLELVEMAVMKRDDFHVGRLDQLPYIKDMLDLFSSFVKPFRIQRGLEDLFQIVRFDMVVMQYLVVRNGSKLAQPHLRPEIIHYF